MLTLHRSAALALLCSLAGCANVGNVSQLQPGVSTAADAERLAHRAPGHVWNNPDGTRSLEYSNQPYDGFQCYMVTVDPKGTVQRVDQVITDANVDKVRTGMTPDEVRRLLCEPRSMQHFPLSGEDVWDWNVEADVDAVIRFNAHFKDGKLVRTSTRRVDVSDCSLGCN